MVKSSEDMKKINLILAATAAAFALVSCDKAAIAKSEEIQEETVQTFSDHIKINITVSDFSGTATKAVKAGWESGDQINIWYDTNIQQKPDLVIRYNGSSWVNDESANVSGNIPSASGTLSAVYVSEGMSMFTDYSDYSQIKGYQWGQFELSKSSTTYDSVNQPYTVPLMTYTDASYTYTMSASTITATLDSWVITNNVQVVITGLPSDDYALRCNNFCQTVKLNLIIGYFNHVSSQDNDYVLPVSNADGYAYMFRLDDDIDDTDFTFTLCNADGTDKRTYSVSGKTLDKTYKKLNAIKIPYSKFTKVYTHDFVEIGGVKWATMNLGATTVAADAATCYGDYYAWGELKPYATGVPRSSDTGSGTITSWSEETSWGGTTGTKNNYNWTNYCGSSSFIEWSDAPYDETSKLLTSTHDAATANWGADWRMATSAEFAALRNACTGDTGTADSTPTEKSDGSSITSGGVYWLSEAGLTIDGVTYGVKGMLFVDKEDTGKRVFFPAAGFCYEYGYNYGGSVGSYWSSSLSTDSDKACFMQLLNTEVSPADTENRYCGLMVRPVVAE